MNNEPVAWFYPNGSPDQCTTNKEYAEMNPPWTPLYTHPVKELHLSLQKSKQTGELLAVTYTDDEHRIVEVLWQRPPELTDEEINWLAKAYSTMEGELNANELADELIEVTGELWISRQCANALRQFGLAESIIKQKELEIRCLKERNKELETFYRNVKARMDV